MQTKYKLLIALICSTLVVSCSKKIEEAILHEVEDIIAHELPHAPTTNPTGHEPVAHDGLFTLANSDMTSHRPVAYQIHKDWAEPAHGDQTVYFKLVFNRIDMSQVTADNQSTYGIPAHCQPQDFIPIKRLFDLNQVSLKQRHDYLNPQSKKQVSCLRHWYGADIKQVDHTLELFKQHQIKVYKQSDSSIQESIITRTVLLSGSVKNFNALFNTTLYNGSVAYEGPLRVTDKTAAQAILGMPSLTVADTPHYIKHKTEHNNTQLRSTLKQFGPLKLYDMLANYPALQRASHQNLAHECNEKSQLCPKQIDSDIHCIQGSFIDGGSCGDKALIHPTELAEIYSFPRNLGDRQHIAILAPEHDYSRGKGAFNRYVNKLYEPSCDKTDDPNTCFKGELSVTQVNDNPGVGGAVFEFDLDLSVIASLAPNAHLHLISVKDEDLSVYDMFENAVRYCISGSIESYDCQHVNIISSSYGNYGQANYKYNIFDSMIEDAALRNITFVQASGDLGSSNKYNPQEETTQPNYLFSTSSQYLTAVGGSSLPPKAARQIHEHRPTLPNINELNVLSDKHLSSVKKLFEQHPSWMWNDLKFTDAPEADDFIHNAVSSGGATAYPQPTYQQQLEQSMLQKYFQHCEKDETGARKQQCRLYPDIALLGGGSTFYIMLDTYQSGSPNGRLMPVAGTSASAPLFAALIARINSSMQQQHPEFKGVGFVNPVLYKIAESENEVFKRDIKGHNCTLFNPNILEDFDDQDSWERTLCFSEDNSTRFYQAHEHYNTASGLGEVRGEALHQRINELYQGN